MQFTPLKDQSRSLRAGSRRFRRKQNGNNAWQVFVGDGHLLCTKPRLQVRTLGAGRSQPDSKQERVTEHALFARVGLQALFRARSSARLIANGCWVACPLDYRRTTRRPPSLSRSLAPVLRSDSLSPMLRPRVREIPGPIPSLILRASLLEKSPRLVTYPSSRTQRAAPQPQSSRPTVKPAPATRPADRSSTVSPFSVLRVGENHDFFRKHPAHRIRVDLGFRDSHQSQWRMGQCIECNASGIAGIATPVAHGTRQRLQGG